MAYVKIQTNQITNWASFHRVCKEVFGFFDGYGNNMDAWIDCVSCLEYDDGMAKVCLEKDEIMNIEVVGTEDFIKDLPEIYEALIECTIFVNQRYIESNGKPRISLIFV
jgi:hypothetical protein